MSALFSIPDYRAPLLEPFRCLGCGRRYLLWQGVGNKHRAEREALNDGAMLIDVKMIPFTYCSCGSLMDLVESVCEHLM
jgi:hypothetical protein